MNKLNVIHQRGVQYRSSFFYNGGDIESATLWLLAGPGSVVLTKFVRLVMPSFSKAQNGLFPPA
jgi:hypothetical protein